MNNRREGLGRLALFLLCVVVASVCLGMLLSQMHFPIRIARNVATIATVLAAIGSYLACYKPGWIYNSLVDMSKGEQ